MASASKKNEIDQKEVDVAEVRKRWRVQEDFGLANQLQDEEYLEHYGLNRTERKQMHQDIKVTKGEQAVEDKYAAEYWEQVRLDQEKEDEKIARELQRILELENNSKLQKLTKADEELARRLHEEETARNRNGAGAPIKLPSAMTPETLNAIQNALREDTKATKPISLEPGMTPETMKAIHEIVSSDRGSSSVSRSRQAASEVQDAELARWLQRRESEPTFTDDRSSSRSMMCNEHMENERNLRGSHSQQQQLTSQSNAANFGNLIDFDDSSSLVGQQNIKPPRPPPPTQFGQNSCANDRVPGGNFAAGFNEQQQRQGSQMKDPRQLGGVAVLPPLPNHRRN